MTDKEMFDDLERSSEWNRFDWRSMLRRVGPGKRWVLSVTPETGCKRIIRAMETTSVAHAVLIAKTILTPYMASDSVLSRAMVEARIKANALDGNGLRVDETWGRYLRLSRSDGRTDYEEQTLAAMRSTWSRFESYFGKAINLYAITDDQVAGYVAALHSEHASRTVVYHIRTVKQILRVVLVRGFDHPMYDAKTPNFSDTIHKRPFSPDQVRALLLESGARNMGVHDMFCVLLATGQRMTDVVCMRAEQVDFKRNMIAVAPGKTRHSSRALIRLPLNFYVRQIMLKRAQLAGPYLFPGFRQDEVEQDRSARARTIASQSTNKIMIRIINEVIPVEEAVVRRPGRQGVRVYGVHSFRATAVTWMAHMGCTPAQICAVTGHNPSGNVWKGYYADDVDGGDVHAILSDDPYIEVIETDAAIRQRDLVVATQIADLVATMSDPSVLRQVVEQVGGAVNIFKPDYITSKTTTRKYDR